MTRRTSEDGFTLLEILIGLAISAMIMVGLSAAMRSVNLGWDQATEIGERHNMITTGLAVAAGDIARVQRIFDNPAKPERFLFVGDRSEIIFPVAERDKHNQKGLYWVHLFLRKKGADIELVRARAPFEPGVQDLPAIVWQDEVVLLRGPFAIEFSYLPPASATQAWEASWTMQNRLPRQVRIDVKAVRGRPLVLPPFVMALEQGAELSCAGKESQFCTLKTGGTFTAKTEVQK